MAGQASVELIALLGILLMVILVFAVYSSDVLSDIGSQNSFKQARESVQVLVRAADLVYSQGEGASTTVYVTLPEGTDMDPSKSYIGKPPGEQTSTTSSANAVNINVDGTDVSGYSRASLTGSFPGKTGTYAMKVTSHGTYVSIGSNLVEVSPSTVYIKMKRGEKKYAALAFSFKSGSVTVHLDPQWAYASPTVALDPASFTSSDQQDAPVNVDLTVVSGNSDAGIYSSQIRVSARKSVSATDSAERESFLIPITVEVEAG